MSKVTFIVATDRFGSQVTDIFEMEDIIPGYEGMTEEEFEKEMNDALEDWMGNYLYAAWSIHE